MESLYDIGQRSGSADRIEEEEILSLLALNPEQVTPNKEKMIGLQVKTRGKQVFFCLPRSEWNAHFGATQK